MQGVANKHVNIFGAILHDSSPSKSQILTIKDFVKNFIGYLSRVNIFPLWS